MTMRLIQLLILCLIVTSCGTGKIKYVRTKGQPQEIVQNTESFTRPATNVQSNPTLASIEPTENIQTAELDEVELNEAPSIAPKENKSVENTSQTSDSRVSEAFRAERKAKSSRGVLIASTALMPIVFFPFATLAGIILLIIGAIQFGKANRSRYITVPGERALSQAKIFLIISSSILALIAILIAVTLVVFFL